MHKKLLSVIKPLAKPVLLLGLVLTLAFSHADGALAARSGGRIGGGSFRAPAPSRTYTSPRTYAPPSGGYYPGGYGGGYGGGFGFPFVIPFFFGGGGAFGGLFTILIFIAIANFLVSSFRRANSGESLEGDTYSSNPTVSVAKVQVGLLAQARDLQADLNQIAETADTSSTAGLTQVLQETSLALLRHPEYWVYGGAESQQTRLALAEAQFNRLALTERSKFSEETLTNVNSQRRLKSSQGSPALTVAEAGGALTNMTQELGEYIVVTILVGTTGKLQVPTINSSDDLRRALGQLGGISSDQLLAVEVLWTPQAEGDTLTRDDMIAEYPNLKLV